MHLEKSGFRGIWWGANPHGVHLATGPDWMHLMLEGLGRHLLSYICTVLKKAGWHKSDFYCNKFVFFNFNNCFSGHDKEVDTYVTKLERRTSALPAGLKVISNGISSVGTISAMDLPGVLIQVALAIGDHSSTKLPPRITRNIQRALYYFFALQRGRSRKLNDDRSVEVRAGARFRIVGYARFN